MNRDRLGPRSRLQDIKASFVVFAIGWAILLMVSKKNASHVQILLALPSYMVMTFGCYALMSIGYSVLKLKAHDEDSESLMKDIDRAKAAIAAKLK